MHSSSEATGRLDLQALDLLALGVHDGPEDVRCVGFDHARLLHASTSPGSSDTLPAGLSASYPSNASARRHARQHRQERHARAAGRLGVGRAVPDVQRLSRRASELRYGAQQPSRVRLQLRRGVRAHYQRRRCPRVLSRFRTVSMRGLELLGNDAHRNAPLPQLGQHSGNKLVEHRRVRHHLVGLLDEVTGCTPRRGTCAPLAGERHQRVFQRQADRGADGVVARR